MAKQASPFKIDGTLGELTFYQLNGKWVVKRKSSITRERVMKDKAFVRLRENMSEFGGASICGKAMRMAWKEVKNTMQGPYISGRLNSRIMQLLKQGDGKRGKRDINLRQWPTLLEGFPFKKGQSPSQLIKTAPRWNLTPDRSQITFSLTIPRQGIKAPKGADQMRIMLLMSLISEYRFDPDSGTYLPMNPTNHQLTEMVSSAPIDLPLSQPLDLQLLAKLPNSVIPASDQAIILAWGIAFSQTVNGQEYPFEQGNCMEIGKVI